MYYGNKTTDKEAVGRAIFSKSTTKRIQETLELSAAHYRNIIFRLRKKKLIVGTQLKPVFHMFYPDKNNECKVVYHIKIEK